MAHAETPGAGFHPIDPPSSREWVLLSALLVLLGLASVYRLREFVVPDMDEGVYVYAGKLITEGSRPYRDFMLAHPPLVPYLAALFWKIGGNSLAATRWLTVALTLASCVPLFLLARRLAAATAAGVIAVVIYHAGLIWVANLGRTVRLETPLNALLIAGAAGWLLGRGRPSALLAGALLGAALSAKLVGVVPVICLASADVAWPAAGRPDWQRRGLVALGAALVLVPLAVWCACQPGFVEWVISAQGGRPREPLASRVAQLGQALLRYPPLLPGLVAAAWQLTQPDSRRRSVALAAAGSAMAAVLLFNTFFRHYLAMALPWLAILLAVVAADLVAARMRVALAVGAAALGVVSPVAFTEISFRIAPEHSSAAATVLPYLERGTGYLLTSAPDFALATGRTLLPWYYVVDNYLGRITGRLADAEFATAAARAGNVVLYPGEIERLPITGGVLAARFRKLAVDPHWVAWEAIGGPTGGSPPRPSRGEARRTTWP